MTIWEWLILGYLILTVASFLPTLHAILTTIKLKPGGESFEKSSFSPEGKAKLVSHYSRLQGTLLFWKREATRYGRFHYYCLWWTILSSSIMPFITQAIDETDPASKWFLTTIAAQIAIILGFHRGLKVAEHHKAFRHGESEFYDMYRRLLDRPDTFGKTEPEQIQNYFEEVETLRRFVRTAETDSVPTVEDLRDQINQAQRKA